MQPTLPQDMPTNHSTEPRYVPEDEIDLIELGEGLWAQRRLIAAITAGVTLLAALYALVATPTYEAVTELRPVTTSAISSLTENDLLPVSPQDAFDRTLRELNARTTQQKAAAEVLGEDIANRLNTGNVFNVSSETEALRRNGQTGDYYTRAKVTAKHSNPETAATLANTLVHLANNATTATLIDELHSTAAARLANLEDEIERRREAARRETSMRIAQLREQDSIQRGRLQNRLDELRTTARKLRQDEVLRLQEALTIARKLDITEPRTDYQNVVNIDTTSRSISSDRGSNMPLYTLGTRWLEAEINALASRESDDHDTREIRELEQRLGELEVNAEIQALQKRDDFTPYIDGISALLSNRSRLQSAMSSSFPDIRAVRIDRSAQPPESPIKPRRALILALAIVLGGMLGVFVALIVNAVQARQSVPASASDGA